MSILRLHQAFEDWRRRGTSMVLVTVTETAGSTYSKAGAQMLINANGEHQGLLSGGCLEGDVAEHARQVLETGDARVVTYDMRDEEEDLLWGLGLGCNGMMRIILQRLDEKDGHEPFRSIGRHIGSSTPGSFALVVESDGAENKPGGALVADGGGAKVFGLSAELSAIVQQEAQEWLAGAPAQIRKHELPGGPVSVLYSGIRLPVRLLLLGAGPDAVPVVALADRLGWRVTVADHRPAYVENLAAAGAQDTRHVDPDALTDALNPDGYDGIVIMSHHLQTDLTYLRALAGSRIRYVGLLGPRARRERLVEDAGSAAEALGDRIYGPIGLDIGADTPEGIALAIVAELHAVSNGRRGGHLRGDPPSG